MDRYAISPDDCLALLAVKEAASLREAARRLSCDPAGLLRKVQRLAQEHGFLQKVRGKWTLTAAALPLVAWTRESLLSQAGVLRGERVLRIASTAWFAERVVLPELRRLARSPAGAAAIHLSSPAGGFESALLGGDCDFVIACHPPENPGIAHRQLLKEPWSVIAPSSRRKKLSLADLGEYPFVRHSEASPAALFPAELPFEIHSSLSIDNLVGIRAAVRAGLGWSFVPTALVADELANGQIAQVGGRYELGRRICLWWLRGSRAGGEQLPAMAAWLRGACERI